VKLTSPAALRNREPLVQVLGDLLPRAGTVLEIASGSGEHVRYFATAFPDLSWQPSDIDSRALGSIGEHRVEAGLPNFLPPVRLDAADPAWPLTSADAVLCINMVHIAAWDASEGLFGGAARVLAAGCPLILYGPFRFDGAFTAPSNAAFDRGLRAENPNFGVRDAVELAALAEASSFRAERTLVMPANNHVLLYRRV
jgi:hypothetical protein